MRQIEDVLLFRHDISPFLVHLCRNHEGLNAKDSLEEILKKKKLYSKNGTEVSHAKFGVNTIDMNDEEKLRYFGAVCFTETPLNEIHCLLEISQRRIDLEPYGLVFLKKSLISKGVSPVIYLNNINQDKDSLVRAVCQFINSNQKVAEELLPLISVFGKKLIPLNTSSTSSDPIDFYWEREWRYPYARGEFELKIEDLFIGLCPHEDIGDFERQFGDIKFIDPRRNAKWYAKKLIEVRKKLSLEYSVV